jgi:hypothetical protein
MRIDALSRRALLRSAAATAAVAPLLFGQSHGGRRVLALIGDRYHNADYIRVALMKMFDGVFVSVDYTIQLDQLSRDVLKNYHLFLCLRDGMFWPGGYLGRSYTSSRICSTDCGLPQPLFPMTTIASPQLGRWYPAVAAPSQTYCAARQPRFVTICDAHDVIIACH